MKFVHARDGEGFPGGSDGEESVGNARDLGSIAGWEDPLEEGMATHSSVLAWRIPWTEEPGGLQSMESDGTESWRSDLGQFMSLS